MRRWLVLTLAAPRAALPAPGQSRVVYRIDVTGTVENGLAPYVARSLREAEAAGRRRRLSRHRHARRPGGCRRADRRRRAGRAAFRSTPSSIPAPSAPAP